MSGANGSDAGTAPESGTPPESGAPPFLAACRREPVPHTPIWVMRQAGRYLPEYRAIREEVDFLTLTKTPELAAEVTLQPVRRFGVDAAILFSDIMTPLEGMGLELEFAPGPVIANPVRSSADAESLRVADPDETVPFVLETIRILRRELPASAPLIGFAGAPFTTYCYAVEGGGSKTFREAKAFMFAEPVAARLLLEKIADTTARYLGAQAEAGAQALMIFDSWAGILSPEAYRAFALPAVDRIVAALKEHAVPLIYFPNQGATLLAAAKELDVDVIGVDWRTPLSTARRILGPELAVQGNLDPAALFAPKEELARQVDGVLKEAGREPGHIFNLGHGIERTTDPETMKFLVDYVHEKSARWREGGEG